MKKRIKSALIALIIVVPLIILGGYPFIIGASIVAFLAFKEIVELKKSHHKFPNMMLLMGMIAICFMVISNMRESSITYGISYQTLLTIILMFFIPIIFYKKDEYTSQDAFYLLAATIFIGLAFNIIIVMRMRGIYTFLYLILIPMITDIFAYLGGRMFGKNKLCPNISPNKTKEGALIGLGVSTLFSTIFYIIFVGKFHIMLIVVNALLSIVGQMGDLIFSKIKRENNIKDFSNIMPGHGGILDRLDSIIFCVIAYVAILMWI